MKTRTGCVVEDSAERAMGLAELQASLAERYRAVGNLGGRNGLVSYRADEVATERSVIVTTFAPELIEHADLDRMLRGLELARGLRHPGLIPIEACGVQAGAAYYVTPHKPGYSVRDKLDAHGPAPLREMARVLRGVGEAVAWLHEHSVSHGLLSADRVLISGADVLLADAGVQAAIDHAWMGTSAPADLVRSETTDSMGAGGSGQEGDVYQLGVLAHELLTGRPPIATPLDGATPSDSILDLLSRRRPEVPKELLTVVSRSLSDEAGSRPPSVQELLSALEVSLKGMPAGEAVEPVPERIGPYRLVELLGRGGMGVVYRAEQTLPVRREVALKLLKLGMDTEELLVRFELERQALARMDHPNIARVLDANATTTGRPYIVMELVSGRPLTDYCDERGLTVRQRVHLFLQVCRAVQHAHQKGVIHRDLKPSNILVSEHDGVPMPKVIDFGLAKAIGDPLTDASLRTAMGQMLGTPAYMSPEQQEGGGAGVDIRTDVYSLGAVLFELLTGAVPNETLGGEVVRPSTSGSSGADSARPSVVLERSAMAEPVAKRRGTGPSGLRRELAGDLDWVTLKALEPDLARRYPTANALERDLERYLADEPVEARAPSVKYRVGKFVRRHRGLVTATAAVATALIAGVATTTTLWLRATRAEARAEAEALTAQRVSDFLVNMFVASNPEESGEALSARDLLDRGEQQIETELGDQPEARARLTYTMGMAYAALGLHDEGIRLLGSASQLSDSLHGPDDSRTVEFMYGLSSRLYMVGRLAEADSVASLAVTRRRAQVVGRDQVLARALMTLGRIRVARSRYQEAESLLLEALEATPEADSVDRALTEVSLAQLLERLGRYPDAFEARRRSVELLILTSGGDAAPTLVARLGMAGTLLSQGRFEEAERIIVEDLPKVEEVFGPDHFRVANQLTLLAQVYLSLPGGDSLNLAEPLLRRALDINGRVYGPESPMLLPTKNSLANALRRQGKIAEAEPLTFSVLDGMIEEYGEDSYSGSLALINVAEFDLETGRPEAGIPYAERSRAAFEHMGLTGHPTFAIVLRILAALYKDAGRPAEGLPHTRRAEEIYASGQSPGDDEHVINLEVYEGILRDLGREAEADSVLAMKLELAAAADTAAADTASVPGSE